MNKNLFLVVFFLFEGLFICLAQTTDLKKYRWTTVETKGNITARHESSLIEYKDKFYLLGGRGLNPVNVFNPKTKIWEEKSKPPLEIHHFQAVTYKNAIYVIGMTGKYPKEVPLENIWLYYPEKDKWEKGAEIPKPIQRGGAGAAVYQDKIYLICGIDFGHTSGTNNNFNSYNLITGEWETLTKAPHIRDHFSTIVVDDNLYCIGGRNSSFHYPDDFTVFFEKTIPYVDVYNFKEKKWHTMKEELPYPTAAGGLVNFQNKIIYFGGEGSLKQAYNTTQCLDLVTKKWTQLAPLNIGRHGGGAVVYNDKIYTVAGSNIKGGANLYTTEVFSLDTNWISLFNGENLNGWEIKNSKKDNDKTFWTVDQGAILLSTLESTENNPTWLKNNIEFDDFELRLKFKTSRENKGNTGVQVRSRFDKNALEISNASRNEVKMYGPSVDISPNDPWRTGWIYDETREYKKWINPALKDLEIAVTDVETKKTFNYFEDEELGWNDLTIICKGMKIITIVNNIVISNYDGSEVLNDRLHKKYNVGEKGFIALLGNMNSQTKIAFKDIELRELKN